MKRRKRTNKNIPAKGRLKDIADSLWSLAVRDDWANRCAVCGSTTVEAHHLIPREIEWTRFELRNGVALCANHHRFCPHVSPHQNASGWRDWLGAHHTDLHDWYTVTNREFRHKPFDRTKTALYYCDVIRSLQEYVEDDVYRGIVGVKFSTWLEDNE